MTPRSPNENRRKAVETLFGDVFKRRREAERGNQKTSTRRTKKT